VPAGATRSGRQAFQEAPITDFVRPVTKRTWLVMDPAEIPQAVHDAFRVAREGRPGPVLIDVPRDVQREEAEWCEPRSEAAAAPGTPDPAGLTEAARLLRAARRPVLYLGGGAVRAGAGEELLALAGKQQVPVTTTLTARGVFPDSHPLALGMPGMHGSYAAVTAMQRADLLVAVGARFDDRVTGRLDGFAPRSRVVHVDVDPGEIGKNRAADVGLVGDARAILAALLEAVPGFEHVDDPGARRSWLATLDAWKEQHPFAYRQPPAAPLKPQLVVERLREATGGRALLTAGVGQHQMWASQFWTFDRPHAWANSGGLGTMGFALPAALGAKAARPDELVIAVDGDGSFQMTVQELATSVAEDLPVLVAILNNGCLGMVKQWQELFFSGHSQIDLRGDLPDFARLAEAYGCLGLRVERPAELERALEQALAAARDRPVVVDFRVDPAEMVFPMVPAGATIRRHPAGTARCFSLARR
jgi:acetolactate synthase-1/2/3 large subunit